MTGKKTSKYKILEELGRGGMGVVYKAKDNHLDRFVALKFLPYHFSSDEQRRIRFLHEAKVTSTLDHPNIGTIYDYAETDDGQMFIAMANYDGETLKDRLKNGPLDIVIIIDIAIQIAKGLSRAHEAGIIHRDIKPANIIITEREEVKILDFGLAKISGDSRITKNSLTPGTISYMSPEQVMGESVDFRSDIWSLGVIIYEMITGNLPFKGDYDQAVTYSILKKKPEPITRYRPGVSKEFVNILTKCLEKKQSERYQSVDNLLVDLELLKQGTLDTPKKRRVKFEYKKLPGKARAFWPILLASILFMVTIGIYSYRLFLKESPDKIMTEIPFTSLNGLEYTPAFSPDAKQIAYYWKENDATEPKIFIKTIATGETQRLTDQPGEERYPAWTPDGQNISFAREENIYIKSALGVGSEKLICSENSKGEHCWSPDSKWLVFSESDINNNDNLCLLSVETGEKRSLTSNSKKIRWEVDILPAFSPDGKKIAFYRSLGFERGDIYTIIVDGNKIDQLTFDDKDIQGLTWTSDSREIVFSSKRSGDFRLWRIPASGGTPTMLTTGLKAAYPTISLDGKKLAYSELRIEQNIWRIKIPNSPNQKPVPEKIIASSKIEDFFQISPDGKRIAFNSTRSGSYQSWLCDSDGQNIVQLTNLDDGSYTPCWSPDGKWITFSSKPNHNYDIFVISINGGTPKRITTNPSHDIFPYWSEDGNWIYFSSNRSGTHHIWKIPINGGTAIQMTKDGARRGFESADSKWLYYRQKPKGTIWKRDVNGGERLLVLDDDVAGHTWSVVEDGIYYLNYQSKRVNFKFFDFATQKIKTVATLELEGECAYPQISPDRQYLYFMYEEPWQADIKLVENWW